MNVGGAIGGSLGAGIGSVLSSLISSEPFGASVGGAVGGLIGGALGGYFTGGVDSALLGAFGAATGGAAGGAWAADTDFNLGHWNKDHKKSYSGIFIASAVTGGCGALCADSPMHLLNVTSSSVIVLLHITDQRRKEPLTVEKVTTSFLVQKGTCDTPAEVLMN